MLILLPLCKELNEINKYATGTPAHNHRWQIHVFGCKGLWKGENWMWQKAGLSCQLTSSFNPKSIQEWVCIANQTLLFKYSKFHFLTTTLSLAIDWVFLQYNSSDFRCPDPAPDLQYICNVGEFSYKDILKEKKKVTQVGINKTPILRLVSNRFDG